MCVKFYLIQFGFAVVIAICLGSLYSGPSVHAKYKTERKQTGAFMAHSVHWFFGPVYAV